MLNKTRKLYSPTINKQFKHITSKKKNYLNDCDLNDNIKYLKTPTIKVRNKCTKVTHKSAKVRLKRNLYSTKLIRAEHIITPKQNDSNCWFNTFFVNFFISDRGRQFTKYLRNCMIEGERMSKQKFSASEQKLLSYINLAINFIDGNNIHLILII